MTTRKDFLKKSALLAAGVALPFLDPTDFLLALHYQILPFSIQTTPMRDSTLFLSMQLNLQVLAVLRGGHHW